MRSAADVIKITEFMAALGKAVKSSGRVYLTGGATALLHGWRATTVDVDLKADPEPAGFFEAIASLKDTLDLNIELAAPDQFIPPLPGWRDRSPFIAKHGHLEFCHYDLYSQALAKIERGHERDVSDVQSMLAHHLISQDRLWELFRAIEPALIRYPAITPAEFRHAVERFCVSPC
ncbi:MAG: DUF6036 family nucleotidyltransferase [Prosthecobacter sp.]